MRARVPIAAASLGSLIVAAACQAQSYHPAELGNCTSTDPKFPCEGEVFGTAVVGDGGGHTEAGLPPGDTQCPSGSGNILYFTGDQGDPVYPAMLSLNAAQASFTTQPLKQDANGVYGVEIDVSSTGEAGSSCFSLFFQSVAPPQAQPFAALTTGDYLNAHGIATTGQSELAIDQCNASMCLNGVGAFHVFDITAAQSDAGADAGETLQSFTASFTQYCSGNTAGPALRGCIHFGP